MGHQTVDINRKTALIVGVLVVGLLLAVYVFNVPWSTLATLAFFGIFVWMHAGMHGSHGGHGMHGGHYDDSRRDEHASHTIDSTRDDNAKTTAPDANTRGLASDGNARGLAPEEQAKSVAREEPRRHHGC